MEGAGAEGEAEGEDTTIGSLSTQRFDMLNAHLLVLRPNLIRCTRALFDRKPCETRCFSNAWPMPTMPQVYYKEDGTTIPRMEVIQQQLEWYFSIENLCMDVFFRSQMDRKGYIPIELIGNFHRMRYHPMSCTFHRCRVVLDFVSGLPLFN